MNAVELEALTMLFRRRKAEPFAALSSLDLSIDIGQVFGLLGPNGSGKTTTVNILCGLLRPTAGRARVLGADVAEDVDRVRRVLGVVPQETALYTDLSARENLQFHARLYGVPPHERRQRIDAMLELVGLATRQHDRVGAFSGGMQRRLALARALLTRPQLVILDEPTLGVDVQSRAALWEHIRNIVKDGRTVLLTTNYMEEAEVLADQIAIIDHGRLVAMGTPNALKRQVGRSIIHVEAALAEEHIAGLRSLSGIEELSWQPPMAQIVSSDSLHAMPQVLAYLQRIEVVPQAVSLRQPDLNDVFLSLTGRALRD